ncbi:type III secretion protein, partial [Escherichia coli]|nr:type III secretion protein [Escherichia coli]
KMKFGSIHCQALLKITLFLQNNISLAVSCLSM